jgi:hypothetical protein
VSELLSPSLFPTTTRLLGVWFCVCYAAYGIGSWITMIFENLKVTLMVISLAPNALIISISIRLEH